MPANLVFPSTKISSEATARNLEIKRANFVKVLTDKYLSLLFLVKHNINLNGVFQYLRCDNLELNKYHLHLTATDISYVTKKVGVSYLKELGFTIKELGQFISNADGWFVRYDTMRDVNYLDVYLEDPDGLGKWCDFTTVARPVPQVGIREGNNGIPADTMARLARNWAAGLGRVDTPDRVVIHNPPAIFVEPATPLNREIDDILNEDLPNNYEPRF